MSCLSDRVEQYLDLGIERLFLIRHHDNYKYPGICTYKKIKNDYHNLRVDGMFSDSNPKRWAAALLYIFCKVTGRNRTQKDIANALDIDIVTIRKAYKKIMEKYNIYE